MNGLSFLFVTPPGLFLQTDGWSVLFVKLSGGIFSKKGQCVLYK